jgi:sec-independent protein translocase protein TatB
MFDVGFTELVLVSIIGLLVLGPQRLPKVAAEIGKWVGRARRTASQLRRQLEREIELSELEERINAAARREPQPQPPPAADPAQPPAPSPDEPPATSAGIEPAGTEPTIAPPAEPDAERDAHERGAVVHELGARDDGVERLEKSRSG